MEPFLENASFLFKNYSNVNRSLEPYLQPACFLSMLGSTIIILTYVCYVDTRKPSRRLLVFLSLMDFGTALSNSVGMFLDFDTSSVGCQIQAAFAIFCSLSSYLWTAAIAVYIYLTIVRDAQAMAGKLIPVFHVLAWGIPLVIVAVAEGLEILGYEDQSETRLFHKREIYFSTTTVTGGWCFLRGPYNHSESQFDHLLNITNASPSWYSADWYEFWVMIAGAAWEVTVFCFCFIVYLLIRIYLWQERTSFVTIDSFRTAEIVDRKLTFIPIVFLILHVWSLVRVIGHFLHNKSVTGAMWLIIAEGLGDSLQGAANCIIFCVFTKTIRNHFFASMELCYHSECCQCHQNTNDIINREDGSLVCHKPLKTTTASNDRQAITNQSDLRRQWLNERCSLLG